MATALLTRWEVTPTGSDTNGGGHNCGGDNAITFTTSGVVSSAMTASAIFSTNSYTFVSEDIGHVLNLISGTNLMRGDYTIVDVVAGSAILNSTLGEADIGWHYDNRGNLYSVITGVSSAVSALSTITWTVDYSRKDSPRYTYTDLTTHSVSAFVVMSASNPFGPNVIGNIMWVSSGTSWTAGRYQILRINASGGAVLDRAVAATGAVSGIANLGGAVNSPGVLSPVLRGQQAVFIKSGTYIVSNPTSGESNSTPRMPNAVGAGPMVWKGYYSRRYDTPSKDQLPLFSVQSPIGSAVICGDSIAGRNDSIWYFVAVNGNNRPNIYGFRHRIGQSGVIINYWCAAYNCTTAGLGGHCYGCFASGCGNGFDTGTYVACLAISCTGGIVNGSAMFCIAAHNYGAGFGAGDHINCLSIANSGVAFQNSSVKVGCIGVGSLTYGSGPSAFFSGVDVDCIYSNMPNLWTSTNGAAISWVDTDVVNTSGDIIEYKSTTAPYTDSKWNLPRSSPYKGMYSFGPDSFRYWGFAHNSKMDYGAVQSPHGNIYNRGIL